MEVEPWQQYGGFYRMVDFNRDWTYTPSVRTLSLPSLPPSDAPGCYPDGDFFVSGLDSLQDGLTDEDLDELGLDIAMENLGEPALPDSAVTSIAEPAPSCQPAPLRRKRFGFAKKWFSSMSMNFRRRKRLSVSRCEERVVPPPPLPPSPSPIPTTPSLSPLQEPIEAEDHQTFDWQAPLALWEWKAWGYYARPWINGVWVKNHPPREDIPENINVVEIASSLVEDGLGYPERWIAGLEHASLPPRPRRWLDDPKPYRPWQCQLNPYLRRKIVGVPPLFWDLGKEPATATHGHSLSAMPLLPADRAQPATWPMTTHFRISAIADDVELAWPILIRNKHGVTVEDVLEWIYRNFQEYVSTDEWEKWPLYLRQDAIMSYDKRRGDGVKRIDHLGFHPMFRGLEPSSDGNSWYLFVGRPW